MKKCIVKIVRTVNAAEDKDCGKNEIFGRHVDCGKHGVPIVYVTESKNSMRIFPDKFQDSEMYAPQQQARDIKFIFNPSFT